MSARSKAHIWLVSLVTLYICLSVTYACVTPLFESPDESSHLQVIDYLARKRRLYPPTVPSAPVTSGIEIARVLAHHEPPLYYTPPLYHIAGAVATGWIGMDDLPDRLIPSPAWEAGWAPQRDAVAWNKNMYVHLPGESIRNSLTVRAAALLRAVSLGLGVLTVICTYYLCQALCPHRTALALGAAACVALNPQFIAISVGVTNDPLIIALFSFFLLLSTRAIGEDPAWIPWVWRGILVGIGLLTKQTALLLLPVGALAILAQASLQGEGVVRHTARNGAAFGLSAALVGGAWYLGNLLRYGDALGTATHFSHTVPLASIGLAEIAAIFETYWAGFGWALISAPRWTYMFYLLVTCLAGAGLIRASLPGGALRREPKWMRYRLRILGSAWLLNVVALYPWAIRTGAPYGRLLFPTIAPTAILLAYGLDQWRTVRLFRRKDPRPLTVRITPAALASSKYRGLVPCEASRGFRLLVAGMLTLAIFTAASIPWLVLRPVFRSVTLPTALPAETIPLSASFEDRITLLGFTVDTDELHRGSKFRLHLYWLATKAPECRYTTWVQLGPQEATERIADADQWLGGTLYPSELWQTGDLVQQSYVLSVPSDAPRPGLYWLRLGLLDSEGRRLLTSETSDSVTLGPWRLRPGRTGSAPANTVDALLSNGIALQGLDMAYRASAAMDASSELTVTLSWKTQQQPSQDYTVFVHLVDSAGVLIGQHDGIPVHGRYPTSWWLAGDVIRDSHTILLSRSPSSGARLLVGMYDSSTGQRLPVLNVRRGQTLDNSIQIAWSSLTQTHQPNPDGPTR